MAKIMLVEDDNNLREIYGARLQAEGHDIVAAKDGEEALALAVKEKPDLIISDVMMPRISGFDMLDILRNAPETKDTKVIMMTALSQAEDKARADKLGADRYLVKSQVTLEDVANVVREVLEGTAEPTANPAQDSLTPPLSTSIPVATAEPTPVVAQEPVAPPAPEPTLEAIANPVVEVHDEPDPNQVQAPPIEEPDHEDVATSELPVVTSAALPPVQETLATTPISVPAEPVSPTAAPQAADDNTASTTIADPPPVIPPASDPITTDDSTTALPPVVEPAATPIKVELPKMPGEEPVPAQASAETAQSASVDNNTPSTPVPAPPVTAQVVDEAEDTSTFIGPNLAEALAAEEDTEQYNPVPEPPEPEPVTPLSDPTPTPVPVPEPEEPEPLPEKNGSPAPIVVQPTLAPPVAEPETPDSDTGVSTGGSKALAGMKVIAPINNETAPDINDLIAAEERKAASDNPVANTVITPGQVPTDPAVGSSQAPPVPAKPEDNHFNNIAL